jgi:hypothetical protein
MFPPLIINIKVYSQQDLPITDKDVNGAFHNIETLFDSILKIIFDNSLYLSIQ